MTRTIVVVSHGKRVSIPIPATRDWYADHIAALDEADRRIAAETGKRKTAALKEAL